MTTATTDTDNTLAVYLRVSGEEQKRRGTIENQRTALDRYLAAYGILPYGSYEDAAVSGHFIAFAKRPEGARLLADAKAGQIKTVLVAKLDRFGRNAREILDAVHELEQAGAHLVSLKEHFDTSTPVGRLMLTMLAAIAEYEWEMIMDRTEAGMERGLTAGRWQGGPPPYGYRVEGKNQTAHLVADDEPQWCSLRDRQEMRPAGVVRLVFDLVVTHDWTTTDIADHLTALGAPTSFQLRGRRYKSGDRDEPVTGVWKANIVLGILHNTIYKGTYTYGQRSRKGQAEVRTIPMPNARLVDDDVWAAAQDTLTRHLRFSKRNAGRDYLLRDLMTCELCGYKYVGVRGRYACFAHLRPDRLFGGAQAKARRCPAPSISVDEIEQQIWSDIEGYLRDPGPALALLAARMSGQGDQTEALRADIAALQREQAAKQSERDAVLALFRKGRITERDLDRQLDDITREEHDLAARLLTLQQQSQDAQDAATKLAGAADLLRELRGRLDDSPLTPALKRKIVETLVTHLRVNVEPGPDTGEPVSVVHAVYCFDPPGITLRTPCPGWYVGVGVAGAVTAPKLSPALIRARSTQVRALAGFASAASSWRCIVSLRTDWCAMGWPTCCCHC